MKLHVHPMSTNSRRALMAALHLGVPVERVFVDLGKRAQKAPEYLALNPNGKVPTLVEDDGYVLWESRAIMMYLADRTPGQTLYPTAPRARADVNHWLFWDAVHFSPSVQIIAFERVIKTWLGMGAPDPKEVERGEKATAPLMAVLDGHLAGRTWLCGDAVTLADYSIATPLGLAARAQIELPPNVAAWLARVQELDAWKQTEPTMPG